MKSLPYHEPGIETILVQSSFILLLNVVNFVIDKYLYCGLVGQIFLGVAWGSPGGEWLPKETETFIVQLGYLGLLLMVYEGGLSTNVTALRANLLISVMVAITGIALPIGLSYVLMSMLDASPIEAFAAGAALCSTSLGTTFTVLSTTGLVTTRLGVVLTSAAMMDDVVGLVMVQVISSLGSSNSSNSGEPFSAVTVVRPVFVAIAFICLVPLIAKFIIKPVVSGWVFRTQWWSSSSKIPTALKSLPGHFIWNTLVLIVLITGSSYAGTSNLLAAYIAGATISWWTADSSSPISGEHVYHKYYSSVVDYVLKPLFFASIGFSIPISQMFAGSIVWKGVVYTGLMIMAKLACGFWLLRIGSGGELQADQGSRSGQSDQNDQVDHNVQNNQIGSSDQDNQNQDVQKNQIGSSSDQDKDGKQITNRDTANEPSADAASSIEIGENGNSSGSEDGGRNGKPKALEEYKTPSRQPKPEATKKARKRKPLTLYPAAIIGNAMVARGEIGFLISSIAYQGIFDTDTYLVTTWAIMLCTIIGPLVVGILVNRVKRLEKVRGSTGNSSDVLGDWGVQ